jgi:hypothetical protein
LLFYSLNMNAQRRAAKLWAGRRAFQFVRKSPENVLRVQPSKSTVTILAARDNFSSRDKTCFVHYLANEGFIHERYRRFSAEDSAQWPTLEWVVEKGCRRAASPSPGATRLARAFMTRLLVYEFLAWVIQMSALFLSIKY